jgi:hypothetical protein
MSGGDIRRAAILALPEAKGRWPLAQYLATKTCVTPAQAKLVLAAAPGDGTGPSSSNGDRTGLLPSDEDGSAALLALVQRVGLPGYGRGAAGGQ